MTRWCAALLANVMFLTSAGHAWAQEAALSAIPQDFRKVVNSAKDKVFPAVVFIKCIRENNEAGRRLTAEASGSGVLISPTGELLTNWHVVDKAVSIRCMLSGGQSFEATLVGSDKDTDVALVQLKLPPDHAPLPYATLGDSTRLSEGDFVMAMGAPWGLSRSVSIGIIACTNRYLPENSEYSLWLQTDASISPGNSGGPLVNTAGEVIGLNARGMTSGGDIGFAIPSETIAELLPRMRKHGKVAWGWTGLELQPLKDFDRNMYFEGDTGVIVADTDPDSPARQAGILPRDRIISLNGNTVRGLTDEALPAIRRTLAVQPPGQPIKVGLLRGDKTLTLDLIPREKGSTQGDELDCPRWDFTVKAINQFDNPELFTHRTKGVFVYGVRSPGNGQSAGLQADDIIVRVQGQEISSLDDLRNVHEQAIKNIDSQRRLVLTILRNGLQRQIVLDFSRDYSRQ